MRCLITGSEGFAGSHLAQHLSERHDEVFGTIAPFVQPAPGIDGRLTLDINSYESVRNLLAEIKPDIVFHCAGLANVKVAWENKKTVYETNFMGAFNVLEAACEMKPKVPKVFLVGSAEQYGPTSSAQQPISEDCPLDPRSPYAVSKVAQEYLGLQYLRTHDLPVYLVRAFNHIGPRQAPTFVASSFARQIALIEHGMKAPVIEVGNIEALRDFTDVRDTVRGYVAVADRGIPGEVYNVCSGKPIRISDLLNTLLGSARCPIEVKVDPALYRPADTPLICGDNRRIMERCGWKPAIPIERTLHDILEYWRNEVAHAEGSAGRAAAR